MSVIKNRKEPLKLVILRLLASRMKLQEEYEQQLYSTEKGYEGELEFDQWIATINDDYLVINDLLIESNGTTFQIDSVIICYDSIFLVDVKNYTGDFYFDGNKFCKRNKNREYKNPLLQLERAESLFRQLLNELGLSFSVKPQLLFINPEFTLYNAKMDQPIIFRSQLKSFITKLQYPSQKLQKRHMHLANQLISYHQEESRYTQLPSYTYGDLKKGIMCKECRGEMVRHNKFKLLCKQCGKKEDSVRAILRSVEEFELLFPTQDIKVSTIYDWCGGIVTEKAIWSAISKKYTLIGKGRNFKYKKKE
ncbi:nuclease-related domain-containing protein [Evansella cellulosilytica]|uniref:NERD domain protein n=1 Tax=Evansella cellulosilytica (strain ATCC 21833 / DSM 2522 / FERM P-1141 / JCM 9156 / N-4) TaxID=649639 RepID=E6TT68_EVAC2|nr:nuclease-related domain-containing protein [Evansella cellulosilytica]ADU31976.1 NERD domain protein [Evansella cellulosilytica DSM 2522]